MRDVTGILAYPLQVLAHLIWSYAVWMILISIILPLPFVAAAIVSGQSFVEAWRPWVSMLADSPRFHIGAAHVMVCLSFAVYFAPRFPRAPKLLTFILATLFGSAVLAPEWSWSDLPNAVTFLATLDSQRLQLATNFLGTVAMSVGAGLFGAFIYSIGGNGGFILGGGSWLGRLIVGRKTFDEFADREIARLRREYDEYAKTRRS